MSSTFLHNTNTEIGGEHTNKCFLNDNVTVYKPTGGYSRPTYDCMSYGLTISNHKPASMWSWALEAAEEQSGDAISKIKIELPLCLRFDLYQFLKRKTQSCPYFRVILKAEPRNSSCFYFMIEHQQDLRWIDVQYPHFHLATVTNKYAAFEMLLWIWWWVWFQLTGLTSKILVFFLW